MYNWTNDLPANMGTYEQYIKILEYIKWKNTNKEINVLEIGTFVGTSIIKILEYLPNSKGTVIDSWKDYNKEFIDDFGIENIFHSNIKIAGLNNINVLKGDSANILQDMILENNHRFDYIYIQHGSHTLFDSYSDLLLSFNLLNKGGVIGIDDYLFNKDSLLESPYLGVNYFLEKFKDKIIVLDKQYRIFIEKL
jgi:predicted O-methyltransferase YrrM